MNRVLVDTNVILDVLLDREPRFAASAALWVAVENGLVEGFLAAHAVTTIHYLIRKEQSAAKTRHVLGAILRVFSIASVDGTIIREALQFPGPDFEDSVTAAAARQAGCSLIVTRDPAGFRGGPLRCLTPEAAAALL